MKPIGKGYGGFDIYPQMEKRYRCDRCGYISKQVTNTFEPTWSWDRVNACPQCPPWAKYPEFGGQTTWTCIDTPESFPDEEAGEQAMSESILKEADELLEAVPEMQNMGKDYMPGDSWHPINHPFADKPRSCRKCGSPRVALPAYNGDWFDCLDCGHSWPMTATQDQFMRRNPASRYPDHAGNFLPRAKALGLIKMGESGAA